MKALKKISLFLFLLAAMIIVPSVLYATGDIPGNDHPHSQIKYAYWAFILGGLSAISLVLGSLLGLIWKPSPKITAVFTAFGGGALLAALSVELVAPTVMMVVGQTGDQAELIHHDHAIRKMVSLIIGCITGGLFFYFLNEMLNSKGGYLRKISTIITYFNHSQKESYKLILKKLSRINIFRKIHTEQLQNLIRYLKIMNYKPGDVIFKTGEMVGGMFIIEKGNLEMTHNGKAVIKIKEGDIVGESFLLYHLPSTYTLVAKTKVRAFELLNDDFDKIRGKIPEIEQLIKKYAEEEIKLETVFAGDTNHVASEEWEEAALDNLHHSSEMPTNQEIKDAAKEKSSAPLAIWLGIFLDGIPESFIIGAGFLILLTTKLAHGGPALTEVIPYTLIAGLFLSNFPEAMSSSIGMRKMGWNPFKILTLWTSLMIMTAIGAVFGYYLSNEIPETFMVGVEGLAAGAMLTMIAQTMIPEAVHIGGHRVVGLGTLAGYLAAVAFKVFE